MKLILFVAFFFITSMGDAQRLLMPSFSLNTQTTQAAYEITNNTGITIVRGKKFTNTNQAFQWGDCIFVNGGSGTIIIENCIFEEAEGLGVETENFSGTLIVRNCVFNSTRGGVYLVNSSGTTIIEYNEFINPHNLDKAADKRSNRGQAVQVNGCSGTIRIRYNKGISRRGEGYTEDWVSLYQSNGSSGNPILVSDNIFIGGGPSASGGGLMTGDSNTPTGSSWQTVQDNILFDVGNYGVACSGGANISLLRNKYYQPSRPWSNVGLYAYDGTAPCDIVAVQNNNVYCNSTSNPPTNHYYIPTDDGAQCTNRSYSGNVSTIDEAGLNLPNPFITKVSARDFRLLCNKSTAYQIYHVSGDDDEFPAALHRPTTVTEDDKVVVSTSTTVNSTGSTSTNGFNYQWILVSGPNNATLTNTTTSTLSLSGLVDGVYVVGLTITDNDGASSYAETIIEKQSI